MSMKCVGLGHHRQTDRQTVRVILEKLPCAATEVECVCAPLPSSMSPRKLLASRRSWKEQSS